MPKIKRLISVRYPCSVETAKRDLNMSREAATNFLSSSVAEGLLFKVGLHYAPTPKLIQQWDDYGMLEEILK